MTTEYKTLLMRRDTSTNFATYEVVPNAGEFCYETDTEKLCIGDGTTAEINLPKFVVETSLIGSIQWFARSTAPAGYLICNGAAVSRTTYARLFGIIGTTFGAGDGSTTFNLPVLTDNRFIEGHTTIGTQHDAGIPSISVNTGTQSANHQHSKGTMNITGGFDIRGDENARMASNTVANGAFYTTTNTSSIKLLENTGGSSQTYCNGVKLNAADNWTGSTSDNNVNHYHSVVVNSGVYGQSITVQPKSLTLLPCIKY